MAKLILGYLVLLLITSAFCLGLLFLFRRTVWRERRAAIVEERKRRREKVQKPPREIQLVPWDEKLALGRRIGLFRQHWRDATLADLLSGFRLPESAYEPRPVVIPPPAEPEQIVPPALPIMPAAEEGWILETLSTQDMHITPHAIAVASNGDLILVDAEQSVILRFDPTGKPIGRWPAPQIPLDRIVSLTVSPSGDALYFIDEADHVLKIVRLAGKEIQQVPPRLKIETPPPAPNRVIPDLKGPAINRWKLLAALAMSVSGIVLAVHGLLLTQGHPPENTPAGLRRLLAGVFLFLLAALLVERKRAIRLPSVFARLVGWLDVIWDGILSFGRSILLAAGRLLQARFKPPKWIVQLAGWLDIFPWQVPFIPAALLAGALVYPLAGDTSQAKHPVAAALCWLAGISLVLVGCWNFKKGKKESDVTVGETILVGALLALALLLRITATSHIPVILGGDEGVIGYASVAFADGQSNNLFNTTLSSPSFYFALQGLSIRVFGHTIEALRFSSVIAGTLAVLAVYWLARTFFNRWMAFLAGAYMAVFHFNIHFSRVALQNIWEELISAVIIAGLWEGWKNKRRSGFLMAGLVMGLAQNFFPAVRLMFVVLFLWFLFLLLRERKQFWRRMPDLVIFGLVCLVVILPLVNYYAKNWAIYEEPLPRSFILSPSGPAHTHAFGSGQPLAQVLKKQFTQAALGYTHQDIQDWYTPETPMLLPLPAALFVIGMILTLFKVYDPRCAMLLILLVGDMVLGVALTTNPPTAQRMVIAVPSVVIIAMLPLERLCTWLERSRGWLTRVGQFVILFLLLFIMVGECYFYFDVYTPGWNFRVANDEIAQRVAEHVDRLAPGGKGWDIYCVCPPRMGYWTHPAMAYLAPYAHGIEVTTPITSPPDMLTAGQKALFIFLPERLGELMWVQQAYPDGLRVDHWYHNGDLLFTSYEVVMP